jgi:hypothetical protein
MYLNLIDNFVKKNFPCMFLRTSGSFLKFSPLLPLTEVSPQPCAIPGGKPPGDWQSAVGWGDTGFKPGTPGQQSGALPLSYHASNFVKTHLIFKLNFTAVELIFKKRGQYLPNMHF